jgi:hypothetical protein
MVAPSATAGADFMVRMILASFIIALASAPVLAAQPAPAAATGETLMELSIKAREARLKRDVPNWLDFGTRALARAPDHPDILISVARANAAAGNTAAALEHLAKAGRAGVGVDPGRLPEFKSLIGDPRFEAAAAAVRGNLIPIAKAVAFADLPGQSEGIAFDPVSRRFFAGADEQGLIAIGMDGKSAPFASRDGLRQLLGLKVDAERRLLWVVSGRYPDLAYTDENRPADAGTGGVRAYHLDTGALVTAVEVDNRPALVHGFNDMALADDGTVYLTDSNTSSVYRLAPGGKTLDLVLRDPGMSFPNGIVMSADGRSFYVAHSEGISLVDPVTRARTLLPAADGSVHGIDGLLLKDGVLYGVQNSPYLHRVVAAALAPDGQSIRKVWTVNSRTPAEYIQTTAAIAGDDLYMIGGNPVPDLYGGTNPAKPVGRIWRVPLKD